MSKTLNRDSDLSIAQIVGFKNVLPGESEQEYVDNLQLTIQELEAKTPLQKYLAQKIFDCLWWIRRYEAHKRMSLMKIMVQLVISVDRRSGDIKSIQTKIEEALLDSDWQAPILKKLMDKRSLTVHTLMQEATEACFGAWVEIDRSIALWSKTLRGLQTSYESLVNRKIYIEHLKLENARMRRDLSLSEGYLVSRENVNDVCS